MLMKVVGEDGLVMLQLAIMVRAYGEGAEG
jgi:hypothetical protein